MMTTLFRSFPARNPLAPHWVAIAAIAAVVADTFTVIVATLNRGFDWSDEGFVYGMIASNRESAGEFFGFQYLLNPLYELLGSSVLAFRVLRLCGYVALGVGLTFIARALLRSRGVRLGRAGWILVGLVAQTGTFAAWSYPPRYLGYNELSSWLTQLGAALVLFLLLEGGAALRGPTTGRRWIWLITGVVLSVLLIAKITAGVFLSLVAVIAALLVLSGDLWWKRLLALIGGIVGGLLVMLVAGVPLLSYFAASAQLGADPSAQAERGYSMTTLMATYLGSMAVTVAALAVPILLAGILALVVRGSHADIGPARGVVASAENVALFLAAVLAVIMVAVVVFPGDLDTWASLGVSNTFLLVLAVLSFAVLARRAEGDPFDSPRRGVPVTAFALGIFAIAPLISALGTNNRIFGHTVFSSTLWAVGAAVGLVLLWQRSAAHMRAVRLLPVLLLGVVVTSSGIAVAGDVFLHPYRTAPYFTQQSKVNVGDLRELRLTDGETELYTWLYQTGQRLEAEGVPALSIASPGALLAFNASGWSAIWPGPTWASSITQACLSAAPDDLFVLQTADEEKGMPAHDRLVAGLKGCDIDFPDDFEIVERHGSDDPLKDVRVWRLE